MKRKLVIASILIMALSSCAPKVGSKEWCDDMKEKPKGDWTANELKDFTKYCVLNQKPE